MIVDGILSVNKPSNITSFGIVSLVRRLTRQKRVGHGGTLDPMATGVLLLLLGKATRIAEYLLEAPKTYRAVVELGTTTNTYDAEGSILSRRDATYVTRELIEQTLGYFRGEVLQEPPMYSAVRSQGKHLYDLARQGSMAPRTARRRTVFRLELVDWTASLLILEVECQGGFYVRSLAHDLGGRLGCGGYLKELRRLKCGEFTLENAVSLPMLKTLEVSELVSLLSPIDAALPNKRAVILTAEHIPPFLQGRVVKSEGIKPGSISGESYTGALPESELCRVYSAEGRFLGVGWWEAKSGFLYPKKVFFSPPPTEF